MVSLKGRYLNNNRKAPARPGKTLPSWPLLLFLWLAVAIPEVALHTATAAGENALLNSGLPLGILFGLIPALAVYALTCLIPKRGVNMALSITFTAIIFLLCASQLVYYRVFGCFYSAYSMANGGGAFQFWHTVLTAIGKELPVILIMALPLLFVSIFGKKCFSFQPPKHRLWTLAPVLGAVALHFILVACLPIFGGTGDMSAYDLYHNNTDAYYSLNKLGFCTSFRLDVYRQLTGYQPSGTIHLPPAPPPTNPTEPPVTTPPPTAPDGSELPTDPTEPPIDTSPNILDIDFDGLIAGTKKKDLQEVHQFFQSRLPSNKNEHTGLFEGCNLILITAEAFDSVIVTEERTPTLYKMMHEGYYFSNFYAPDWGVSTTDGEYVFLTGTVPKSGVWSFKNTAIPGEENLMPLTMAQQLIAQGYNAYAYHGHTYTYYNRNWYLENLGYDYKGYGQGLPVKKQWPESDVEVVDLSTPDFASNEPFTAYYMSISGHREFNFYGNCMAYKNRDLVENEPYSTNVRAYIACQLELEHSLTLLLERLEEAGTLDNTVIVISPDHYPNGLTNAEMSELFGHDIETNFEIFKNGCVIYKPGMTPETVDAPTSPLDLLPTLSNLFGLEFDSRLYMGRDVFSDAEPFVMFRNRSWISDKASYNAKTGAVTNFTDTPVDEEYIARMKNELSNRFTVSSRILDYDYWRILFGE